MLAKSVNSRRIDPQRFIALMKDKPKGTAEVWYEPDDTEAHQFASEIHRWLGPDGAGWSVLEPKALPVKSDHSAVFVDRAIPGDELRQAASTGLAIATKKWSLDLDSAQGVLSNALNLSVGGWGIAGLEWILEQSTLADNYFVIVVGHHKVNVPLVKFGRPKH